MSTSNGNDAERGATTRHLMAVPPAAAALNYQHGDEHSDAAWSRVAGAYREALEQLPAEHPDRRLFTAQARDAAVAAGRNGVSATSPTLLHPLRTARNALREAAMLERSREMRRSLLPVIDVLPERRG